MRKSYFLCVALALGFNAGAQIVNIPDANFKNYLLSSGVDTDGDGEIQLSEAAVVTEISTGFAGIVSFEGIQAFTNLEYLTSYYNPVTSLDVSGLTQLIGLDVTFNELTTLDLSSLTNLQWVNCNGNQLTSLVLGPNVRSISADNNQLTELNFTHWMTGYVRLANNQLQEIIIPSDETSYFDSGVDVSNNPCTNFSISAYGIIDFDCSNLLITSFDFSHIKYVDYLCNFSDNPNLQYINFKNGYNDSCTSTLDGECLTTPTFANVPQLSAICVDDDAEASDFDLIIFNENVSISSYCTFVPGGNHNAITGSIRYDLDGNGCGLSDAPAAGVKVAFGIGSSSILGSTFSNVSGNYTSYSGLTQTLQPQVENPYFTISPSSHVAAFPGYGNTATVDFCIAPNGVHPDLEITLIPLTVARPGFDAMYKIHYENKGTETQSGTVSLVFEDDVTDLVSANPATDAQAAGSLTWNFSDLAPFESREITVVLNVNSPLETPAVNLGDILDFTATVAAGTDETPSDNTFELDHFVVGSFDPNDKAVSRESIGIAQLGDYLYYTVRFQNTGTFYAENVVVKDMLSPNLDLTSLQMISASHPYRATLTDTNKFEFFFEGINLPAVVDDEPGSHGYVTFKIKPKNTLAINDVIENQADIYFDFNAPITTNTVTTTVTALGNPEVATASFVLYPNPVKNMVSIQTDAVIKAVRIYNALGQLVKNAKNQTTIDVSDLTPGSYVVEITSANGKATKKLIKL